jgi:hypothetical protein
VLKLNTMTRKLLVLLFLVSWSIQSFSQCNYKNITFSSGELVEYKVYYKLGFLWFNAAKVVFEISDTIINNQKAYKFDSYGTTLPNYDWIYKVRDSFQSIVDSATLRPIQFLRDTREGNYIVNNEYWFDYSSKIIYSIIENSDTPKYSDTLNIEDCTQDVLTAIYVCRNLDITNLNYNDTIKLNMLIDNKIHKLYLRYQGKENTELEEGGVYRCRKFTILLVEGTIFSGGENLSVWISDDKAKVPIRVEAEILVGSIVAQLKSLVGNKWPLNSVTEDNLKE